MLDSVHNLGLRLCTGAFRTTLELTLYAKTGFPSLSWFRDIECLKFYFRLGRQPNGIAAQDVYTAIQVLPECSPRTGYAFPSRCRELLDTHSLLESRVIPWSIPGVAPWILNTVSVCTDLHHLAKKSTSPLEFQSCFAQHVSECHFDSVPFYTDGSKTNKGVGYGCYSSVFSRTGVLPPGSSIYTAELAAILVVLRFILRLSATKCTIYVDSRSVMSGIASFNSQHPAIPVLASCSIQVNILLLGSQPCWNCW